MFEAGENQYISCADKSSANKKFISLLEVHPLKSYWYNDPQDKHKTVWGPTQVYNDNLYTNETEYFPLNGYPVQQYICDICTGWAFFHLYYYSVQVDVVCFISFTITIAQMTAM